MLNYQRVFGASTKFSQWKNRRHRTFGGPEHLAISCCEHTSDQWGVHFSQGGDQNQLATIGHHRSPLGCTHEEETRIVETVSLKTLQHCSNTSCIAHSPTPSAHSKWDTRLGQQKGGSISSTSLLLIRRAPASRNLDSSLVLVPI